MNGNNIIYWDACIFLSYLKGENRPDPLDMLGVEELVQLIDDEDVDLVTSTISLTEILASTLPPDAKGKLNSLFGRRNIHLVEVSKEIALIAHELRDYYKNVNDGLPTLTTPDAIHIATAIKMSCSKMYTFDENDRKKKSRAILPLAQPLIGKYQISILKPRASAAQMPLFNKGSRI